MKCEKCGQELPDIIKEADKIISYYNEKKPVPSDKMYYEEDVNEYRIVTNSDIFHSHDMRCVRHICYRYNLKITSVYYSNYNLTLVLEKRE